MNHENNIINYINNIMVSSNIPPKKLWLELDNSKIDFEDKQQINIILNYIPESYELLEQLYVYYFRNKSYIKPTNFRNYLIFNNLPYTLKDCESSSSNHICNKILYNIKRKFLNIKI